MIGQNAPTDPVDRFARELADMRTRIAELERARPAIVPWIAPTLAGTWVNFGGTLQIARYRKIGDIVYVEGFVKSGSIGTAVFVLPAGYRPTKDLPFAVHSNIAFGSLVVQADGSVIAQAGSNTSFGLNVSFSTT